MFSTLQILMAAWKVYGSQTRFTAAKDMVFEILKIYLQLFYIIELELLSQVMFHTIYKHKQP